MAENSKISEKKIVEGCVNNDRYSQELLYRKHFSVMMYFVMRYTEDREEALEILNNGFLRVFKKIHLFSFKGSLEGWIRKLVFHAISDYFRSQSKLHFLILEDHDKPEQESSLEKFYAEDLMRLVDHLPNATQQVFRYFALDGYSHKEIAEMLNISIGTSKWHLSEARKRLKEMIRQQPELKHYGRKV